VQGALDAVSAELAQDGDPADPHTVAGLHRRGAIRIMLKGGNNVCMIKFRALRCLPPRAAAVLSSLAPTSLSDVDFLLMIDYVRGGSWLAEVSNHAMIHERCCAAAERALEKFAAALDGSAAAAAASGNDHPLAQLLEDARCRPQQLSATLCARLNAATAGLASEIETTLRGYRDGGGGAVRVALSLPFHLFDIRSPFWLGCTRAVLALTIVIKKRNVALGATGHGGSSAGRILGDGFRGGSPDVEQAAPGAQRGRRRQRR
jgi:hypothetical protein